MTEGVLLPQSLRDSSLKEGAYQICNITGSTESLKARFASLFEGGGSAEGDDGRSLMSLPYRHNLIDRAKELRRDATPQENHLWYDFLRSYPIRFQRQKTIGSFIADFQCHHAKLVIEIDGSQHYEPQGMAYDEERTSVFSEYGIEVLRFSNADINTQFKTVCEAIDQEVKKRVPFEDNSLIEQ